MMTSSTEEVYKKNIALLEKVRAFVSSTIVDNLDADALYSFITKREDCWSASIATLQRNAMVGDML